MNHTKKVYERIFNEFLLPDIPWVVNIEIVPDNNKVFVDCYLDPNNKTIRGINCDLLIGRFANKMGELLNYVGVPIKGWIRFYDEGKVICFKPFSS